MEEQGEKAKIEAIVAAAARPCPEIVEAFRYRHKKNGSIFSVFGIPLGVSREDLERISIGFVYRDKNGTTFGKVYESSRAAVSAHGERAKKAAADFRVILEGMKWEELEEQAEYWLKSKTQK